MSQSKLLSSCRRSTQHVARRGFSTLPSQTHYDTVVVGGGIAGISSGWALAKRGQKVLVVEQNTLTSGSTWHAAGLVTHFKGDPGISELSMMGRELFLDIEREGDPIGWHQTGSLAISRSINSSFQLTDAYLKGTRLLDHKHDLYTIMDNKDVNVIEKWEEVEKIHPFMKNPNNDFVCAVHSPNDGIVNPADATIAIAKRAKKLGCEIRESTPCTGFTTNAEKTKITGIKLGDNGHIVECGNVVLAGAAWTRGLAKYELDAYLPLAYGPHQYTIFEKIKGVSNALPVIREFDFRFYLKPEVGGFMLGVFESQPIPHIEDFIMQRSLTGKVPRDAMNEVYEESIEKAGEWFESALEVCPVLAETGISQWLHGPDTHSTDHGFVMGPMLQYDNGYVVSGFNSQGIQCGPGVGTSIAEWILDGYPQSFKHHFEGHNVRRVNPDVVKDDVHTTYRALESYGGTYLPHFPREQVETVRGTALKSPFYDVTIEKGGVFGEAFGWERPVFFKQGVYFDKSAGECQNEWEELSPIESRSKAQSINHSDYSFDYKSSGWFQYEKEESLHCRKECVAFDMTPFAKIVVTGADAEKLVNYAVTGNVANLKENSLVYTCYLNPKTGGVVGDLTVCRLPAGDIGGVNSGSDNSFYCVLPASDAAAFDSHLRKSSQQIGTTSSVSYQNITNKVAVLAVMGPKSRQLFANAYPDFQFDNASFPFGAIQQLDATTRALRVSFAGELGWELHCENETAMKTYNHIFTTAENCNIDLRDAGMFSLLQSLRTEKGFVHNGHDIHPMATPQESGLAFTVAKDKEDFAGKAALAKRKLTKRLVSFILPDDIGVSPQGHFGEIIYRNDKQCGYLTSGGYSHHIEAPIGMGFVSLEDKPKDQKVKAFIEEGAYTIEMVDKDKKIVKFPVQVSFSCVFDPKGTRVQFENGVEGAASASCGASKSASATC